MSDQESMKRLKKLMTIMDSMNDKELDDTGIFWNQLFESEINVFMFHMISNIRHNSCIFQFCL